MLARASGQQAPSRVTSLTIVGTAGSGCGSGLHLTRREVLPSLRGGADMRTGAARTWSVGEVAADRPRHGARAAPLRRDRAAAAQRADAVGAPQVRRRRPRPPAAAALLPRARLPAGRRSPTSWTARSSTRWRSLTASMRAAGGARRPAAGDGRLGRPHHPGPPRGHQPDTGGDVRRVRRLRPDAVRRRGARALGRHRRLPPVAAAHRVVHQGGLGAGAGRADRR